MRVKIYTTPQCPYCINAKQWFDSYNVEYTELNVATDKALQESYVRECPGRRTVPQILIDGELIGGYDELIASQDHVKDLLGLPAEKFE